jgi:hypothetical protein
LGNIAAVVFMVAMFAALAYVVVAIVQRSFPTHPVVGWTLAFLILVSPAATDAIYVGQITPLIAVGYGASWLAPRTAGWWGVAGGALKLFPVVLMVVAFRQKVSPVLPLAFGLALVVISGLWLGFGAYTDFATAAVNGQPQCHPPSLGSLTCAFGSTGAVVGIVGAVLLVLIATTVRSSALSLLLLATVPLAAAPDVFPNYLLVLAVGGLPAAAELSSRLVARRGPSPVHANSQ